MSQRPRFRDAELDGCFEREGYVVLPGAALTAVRPLRRIHRRLVGKPPPGFHSTPYFDDSALKLAVHQQVTEQLSPIIQRILEGHRVLLSSFISKARGPASVMPPHQDWTFVDERAASSMNFWVPLVDADHRNGALSVLPRSHLLPGNIRGTDTANSFAEVEPFVVRRMVELPMAAGDVVIHDHRLVHASPPNTRRRPRLVAGCALLPDELPAVHFRQAGPGRVERHLLDDRFFTDHTHGASDFPASAHLVGEVEHENPLFTREQIIALDPTAEATNA